MTTAFDVRLQQLFQSNSFSILSSVTESALRYSPNNHRLKKLSPVNLAFFSGFSCSVPSHALFPEYVTVPRSPQPSPRKLYGVLQFAKSFDTCSSVTNVLNWLNPRLCHLSVISSVGLSASRSYIPLAVSSMFNSHWLCTYDAAKAHIIRVQRFVSSVRI